MQWININVLASKQAGILNELNRKMVLLMVLTKVKMENRARELQFALKQKYRGITPNGMPANHSSQNI